MYVLRLGAFTKTHIEYCALSTHKPVEREYEILT